MDDARPPKGEVEWGGRTAAWINGEGDAAVREQLGSVHPVTLSEPIRTSRGTHSQSASSSSEDVPLASERRNVGRVSPAAASSLDADQATITQASHLPSEGYRAFLFSHMAATRSHFSGKSGFVRQTNQRSFSKLRASRIAGTWWTPDEKERFFAALSRHARHRPDLIARDVGEKPVTDVVMYLHCLDREARRLEPPPQALRGYSSSQQHKARKKARSSRYKHREKSVRLRRPAASEASDEWIRFEEAEAQKVMALETKVLCKATSGESVRTRTSFDDQCRTTALWLSRQEQLDPRIKPANARAPVSPADEADDGGNTNRTRPIFVFEPKAILSQIWSRTLKGSQCVSAAYREVSRRHPMPCIDTVDDTWRLIFRLIELNVLQSWRYDKDRSAPLQPIQSNFPFTGMKGQKSRWSEYSRKDKMTMWLSWAEDELAHGMDVARETAKARLLERLTPDELAWLDRPPETQRKRRRGQGVTGGGAHADGESAGEERALKRVRLEPESSAVDTTASTRIAEAVRADTNVPSGMPADSPPTVGPSLVDAELLGRQHFEQHRSAPTQTVGSADRPAAVDLPAVSVGSEAGARSANATSTPKDMKKRPTVGSRRDYLASRLFREIGVGREDILEDGGELGEACRLLCLKGWSRILRMCGSIDLTMPDSTQSRQTCISASSLVCFYQHLLAFVSRVMYHVILEAEKLELSDTIKGEVDEELVRTVVSCLGHRPTLRVLVGSPPQGLGGESSANDDDGTDVGGVRSHTSGRDEGETDDGEMSSAEGGGRTKKKGRKKEGQRLPFAPSAEEEYVSAVGPAHSGARFLLDPPVAWLSLPDAHSKRHTADAGSHSFEVLSAHEGDAREGAGRLGWTAPIDSALEELAKRSERTVKASLLSSSEEEDEENVDNVDMVVSSSDEEGEAEESDGASTSLSLSSSSGGERRGSSMAVTDDDDEDMLEEENE